jgi:NADH dehydrogenase FAD-containing subunit
MARPRIIVVGAGYAGRSLLARLAARRVDAELMLVDPSPTLTERVRWHERLATNTPDTRPLSDVMPARVEHVVARMVELDPHARTVTTSDGRSLAYDHLALTMGSASRAGAAGAVLEDGGLPAEARAVAVVGGGATGVEVAAELAEARPELTVHLVAPTLLEGFCGRAVDHARAALERLGVTLHEGDRAAGAAGGRVVLASGDEVAADVALWCVGLEPARVPTHAALPLDARGRVVVAADLSVPGFEGLWCAGDQARVEVGGAPLRAACAVAMPMGMHLAGNLASVLRGAPAAAFRLRTPIACVSLGRRDGLVQHLDAQNMPTERVWTGRAAAWIKEGIVRMTIALPRAESRLRAPLYVWPKSPQHPLTMLPAPE